MTYRCLRCGESRAKKSPCPPPPRTRWSHRYDREAREKGLPFLPPRPELLPATATPPPEPEPDEFDFDAAVRALEDADTFEET
jgi:hypothetical protein